jgi:hypothetical protein
MCFFDLTNTYFEGQADANSKAKRGRSKEKRSDCKLMTLALVIYESRALPNTATFTPATRLKARPCRRSSKLLFR